MTEVSVETCFANLRVLSFSLKNDLHFRGKHYLDLLSYLFNARIFNLNDFISSSFAQRFCVRARLENEMIDSLRAMKVSKQFRPYFKGCSVEIYLAAFCQVFLFV